MVGAGATASLGIKTTSQLGKVLYTLVFDEAKKGFSDRVAAAFPGTDYEFQKDFTGLLELISGEFGSCSFTKGKRAKELQQIYDWHTLELIAKRCPITDENNLSLGSVYNLIDLHLQSGHGFRVNTEFIKPERLQAARNTVNMVISFAHAISYQQILKDKQLEYRHYYEFAKILARKMRQEGLARRNYALNSRKFYIFSYAVISMNWDPLLLWLVFNAHKELNDNYQVSIGNPALP